MENDIKGDRALDEVDRVDVASGVGEVGIYMVNFQRQILQDAQKSYHGVSSLFFTIFGFFLPFVSSCFSS